MANTQAPALSFDGSNWEDLNRLVMQSTLARLLESEVNSDAEQCAWLSRHFVGPPLDWVASQYAHDNTLFSGRTFQQYVSLVRQHFGISDDGLRARRRGQLEGLAWNASDLPTFFAEFDRLTAANLVTGDESKITLLRSKLPVHVQKLLAEQALDFANYDTMRERLLTMWSLDPNRNTAVRHSGAHSSRSRPKCGRCGKKGHKASECHAAQAKN